MKLQVDFFKTWKKRIETWPNCFFLDNSSANSPNLPKIFHTKVAGLVFSNPAAFCASKTWPVL